MDGLSKLGIDLWSIGVYFLNAGLLLFVLSYLLYKPVLGFMDRRRDEIRNSLDEARLLKDELDKKSEEASTAQARFENELKVERESFRKFAEEKRSQLEAEMNATRAAMMQKAEAEIEARKTAMVKEVEEDLLVLIKKIVLDIVRKKVPEEVVKASVKDAWKEYK